MVSTLSALVRLLRNADVLKEAHLLLAFIARNEFPPPDTS